MNCLSYPMLIDIIILYNVHIACIHYLIYSFNRDRHAKNINLSLP